VLTGAARVNPAAGRGPNKASLSCRAAALARAAAHRYHTKRLILLHNYYTGDEMKSCSVMDTAGPGGRA